MPYKQQNSSTSTGFPAPCISALVSIIDSGSGNEWLTLKDLKLSGSHPFSNSTRRRKIERHEYPAPVKLSSQMCVWRSSEIRTWRQDPTAYHTTEHEPTTYKNGLLGVAVVLKGAKS